MIFILAFNNTKTIHEYTDGNLGFVTLPILFVCVSITCLNEFKKIKPICKWLGKLSTCIYLVHWQCMTMIKTMCEKKIINWGGDLSSETYSIGCKQFSYCKYSIVYIRNRKKLYN